MGALLAKILSGNCPIECELSVVLTLSTPFIRVSIKKILKLLGFQMGFNTLFNN